MSGLRTPPKKRKGQGTGERLFNGAMLDVRTGAAFVGATEKVLRGQVERRVIPFRRLGGRIIFLRAELEAWMKLLGGCTLDEAMVNVAARQPRS